MAQKQNGGFNKVQKYTVNQTHSHYVHCMGMVGKIQSNTHHLVFHVLEPLFHQQYSPHVLWLDSHRPDTSQKENSNWWLLLWCWQSLDQCCCWLLPAGRTGYQEHQQFVEDPMKCILPLHWRSSFWCYQYLNRNSANTCPKTYSTYTSLSVIHVPLILSPRVGLISMVILPQVTW